MESVVPVAGDLIRREKYPGNPLLPVAENRSSGILIGTGSGYRFNTTHPALYLPAPPPRFGEHAPEGRKGE